MSKKKKRTLIVASLLFLAVLSALGGILHLQARPESAFAQFLQRCGVPVESVLEQPQIAAVSAKLVKLIPGVQVHARGANQDSATASPAVFNGVTLKGVIGGTADSTAVINASGQTVWVKVGEQFSVKVPKGSVTLRCEEIRPDTVVLGVANSELRKEYALR